MFRTTETEFTRIALLFLGLTFSVFVFTWGLQYKLSLYDPPQAVTHQMPEAKLLSKNEQAVTAKSPLLDISGARSKPMQVILSSIFLLISLALNPLHAPLCIEKECDVPLPWRLRCFACLDAFFFRPPPVLA